MTPESSGPVTPREPQGLLAGSIWVVLARWVMRVIGLISTLILARLLSPSDFGLIALAMLVVGLLQTISDTGQRLALIRHAAPERSHYDTVWTVSLLIGCAIAAALVLMAPLAARYFQDDRLVILIQVLALRPLIGGLENIGTVDFRRNGRFDVEFRFLLWPRLIGTAVTISGALALGDYRALVGGILAQQAATILLSYIMHPYRPRLSLEKVREIWSFSIWTLVASIGNFWAEKTDEIVVGRLFDTSTVGQYHVAQSVAAMPIEEIVVPPTRALFPAFARAQGKLEELRRLFLDSFSTVWLIAIAASVGMAAVAEDAVVVLLGPQWHSAIPLVPWLALGAAFLGVLRTVTTLFSAMGRARQTAIYFWGFGLALTVTMFSAEGFFGLVGVAAARAIGCSVFLLVAIASLSIMINLPFRQIIERSWRPVISAALMYVMLDHEIFHSYETSWARLLIKIPIGGALFLIVDTALWRASGSPLGAEENTLSFIRSLWSKVTAKFDRPGR